jgi:CRP/FNR family transcriptional regulator, dissimilatory nitrate respiration regulator
MKTVISDLPPAAITRTLRRSRLFAGAMARELEQIAAISVLRKVSKGETIFHEGTFLTGFYVMQKGAVKIRRVNIVGMEQVLHVFRPCESFGEEMLFLDSGYPADACAIEDSQVVLVKKNEFVALLKRQPELALRILKSMDGHLRQLVGLLGSLTLKDVKTRLVDWLIQHCPNPQSDQPYTIELGETKRAIASQIGTVSETFSRALGKLRRQNLLEVHGNRITLFSPFKLAQLAESCG